MTCYRQLRALALGVFALLVAVLAWAPTTASATATGVTMTASASPTAHSAVDPSGVGLNLGFSASYNDFPSSQQLQGAVFHLDNDFAFDGTGIATCQRTSILGKFHGEAVAACPNSIVGSGTAEVNDGGIKAVLDVFFGGGNVLYVHADVGPGATTFTSTGTLGDSSRGGDFGKQLDVSDIPNTPGLVFTRFNLGFPGQEHSPGHHYVSARCQPDGVWDFAGVFKFFDGSMFTSAASQACASQPTGKRAKALKRCKLKHRKALSRKKAHDALTKPVTHALRKDFTKCKRKARKLPV